MCVCVCVCVTESLFSIPETNTILQITLLQFKKKREKFKNKKDREASETEMNKMTQGERRPVLRLFNRKPEHELQHREKPIYRQEKALQSSHSLYFIKDSCNSRSFSSNCVWGPKWFLTGADKLLLWGELLTN